MKKVAFTKSIPLPLNQMNNFRLILLNLIQKEDVFAWLDSNDFYINEKTNASPIYHSYDLIVGIGAKRILKEKNGNAFSKLEAFKEKSNTWLMGYLGYDLKNEIEQLDSQNLDTLNIPELFFFEPELLVLLKDEILEIRSENEERLNKLIDEIEEGAIFERVFKNMAELNARTSQETYINDVNAIRQEIEEGNVYELNYCQEYYAEEVEIEPFSLFNAIREKSPQPFSAFLHFDGYYVISASMERFLKKSGEKLISQPIKGTIRRSTNPSEDKLLQMALYENEKERAENVMIVDLVRNDLAKSCQTGTVKVEELFGIYPFPFVHQMISTVTGKIEPRVNAIEAIKAAFPMGSMTGAPKVSAMTLIEKFEKVKRGIYSGAIGYFDEEDNFDFNVVIRTLVYHQEKKYLSIQVGSAITYDSEPEQEYAECKLKIKAWREVLSGE